MIDNAGVVAQVLSLIIYGMCFLLSAYSIVVSSRMIFLLSGLSSFAGTFYYTGIIFFDLNGHILSRFLRLSDTVATFVVLVTLLFTFKLIDAEQEVHNDRND